MYSCTYYFWRIWSCVISMNRWCLWSGIGVKNNLMSIFYVALSTCSVVLPICHDVVLSTWSVILPIILSCRLVYLLCRLVALWNGAYRSVLPAKTQVTWLFVHSQRMPTHVGPLIQDWSVSVLFPWYKGNFFNLRYQPPLKLPFFRIWGFNVFK